MVIVGTGSWVLLFCIAAGALDERVILDDLDVVAQKIEQPVQSVPKAVTALSGNDLLNAGARDLFDVAQLVPSLDAVQNTGPLNTAFRIRRIGNEPNIATFEPAVGLFVDEAFRSRSGVASGDLFDIERIEIVRGPQTTLYGKNTTAGVINVITRKPTPEFEFFGEVTAGRFDVPENAGLTRFQAAVGGPLSGALSGRISGAFFDHDELTVNLLNGDDTDDMRRYAVRGQLLYEPGDELEARLILNRTRVDSAHAGDLDMDHGTAIAAINERLGVACPSMVTGDRALCRNRAGIADLHALDATLKLDYSRADYALALISAYEDYEWTRDFDADQTTAELVDLVDRQHASSYSQELRLMSPVVAGRASWMVGAFYFRNEFVNGDRERPAFVLGTDAPQVVLAPGLPLGQPGDSGFVYGESDTTHTSIFANVVWPLTERLDLTTGVRWQTESKHALVDNSADHSRPTVITRALLPAVANTDLARDTEGFSWSLIGRYRWSENVMAYASVTKGFKSGGFNIRTGNVLAENREFDDETVISTELGVKSTFAGGRLRLNASLFRSDYDDFHSAGFVGLRFQVNNAKDVELAGIEVDLQAALTNGLTGGLAVSYVDAKYEQYEGGGCHFGRNPDNADRSACVLSGARLPLAPRWASSANLQYTHGLSRGSVTVRADWQWTSDYNSNQTLDPRHVQDSFHVLNLRAGWQVDPFELVAWIRNLADAKYVLQSGPSNLFGRDAAYGQFLGEPRSAGLSFRVRW